MSRIYHNLSCVLLTATLLFVGTNGAAAAEKDEAKKEKERIVQLARGKVVMLASKQWKKVKPASRIVEVEFSIPPVKGLKQRARLTFMGATGGVPANIERWKRSLKNQTKKPKVEKQKVRGFTIHYVDISGRYQPPPFRRAEKPIADARMLGAIIETQKYGLQFVKLYGERKTISANEKAFKEMLSSLKIK